MNSNTALVNKPMPTADELAKLPELHSYLRWVREEVFSWELENVRKGVERFGIRTLSAFCEMVGLDEKYTRIEIKKAEKEGHHFCIVDGWRISWRTIDDVRGYLEEKGVALTPRMTPVKGKFLRNKKDFDPGDYELNKCVEKMMR
jgi:hypothetical protein